MSDRYYRDSSESESSSYDDRKEENLYRSPPTPRHRTHSRESRPADFESAAPRRDGEGDVRNDRFRGSPCENQDRYRPRPPQQDYRRDNRPKIRRGVRSMDGDHQFFYQDKHLQRSPHQPKDEIDYNDSENQYQDRRQQFRPKVRQQYDKPPQKERGHSVSPHRAKVRFYESPCEQSDRISYQKKYQQKFHQRQDEIVSEECESQYEINERQFRPRVRQQYNRSPRRERSHSVSPYRAQARFGENLGKKSGSSDENIQTHYYGAPHNFNRTKANMGYAQPKFRMPRNARDDGNAGIRAPKVITPEVLVGILTKYPDYKTSLQTLYNDYNLKSGIVRNVTSTNPNTFYLNRDSLRLSPRIMMCFDHTGNGCFSKPSCNRLHICPNYVNRTCTDDSCHFGHKWKTNHNVSIFKMYYIHEIRENDIHSLMAIATRRRSPNYPLDICLNYNRFKCKFANCRRLHICFSFAINGAQCMKSNCKLNHKVTENHCQNLFKAHGIATDETPRDIIAALIAANPRLNKPISCNTGMKKPQQKKPKKQTVNKKRDSDKSSTSSDSEESSTASDSDHSRSSHNRIQNKVETVWSHYLRGDVVIPEICYKSVKSQCNFEGRGCKRLHATQHYHWQVRGQTNGWFNLREAQVKCLEIAFCDSDQDGVVLPQLKTSTLDPSIRGLLTLMGQDKWHADFQLMEISNPSNNKCLQLRRLCTEITSKLTPKECTYLWYFMDYNKKWIEYGTIDSTNNEGMKSTIKSSDIEQYYQQNAASPMHFQTSQFQYTLDFDNMIQINQTTRVSRRVRRRPQPHLQQSVRQPPKVVSKSHWSYHLTANVTTPEICFDSVEGTCEFDSIGCPRLHAKQHFHWQVQGQDNHWYNLQPSQITTLEVAFCDPSKESVSLPLTHASVLEKSKEGLSAILGNTAWQACFQTMKMSNSSNNTSLVLRRLCTQNSAQKTLKENTYAWYFLDIKNEWIEYGQYDTTRDARMKSNIFPSEIEARFCQNPSAQMNFNTGGYQYILDFSTMEQVNQSTKQKRKVRRRPKPHLKDTTLSNIANDLPSTWDPMPASEKLKIVYLSPSSAEYLIINDLFMGQLPQVQIVKIKRVQNPKLWAAFQNNMKSLTNVDVCQMFFGTKHSAIPNICYDNAVKMQNVNNTSTQTQFSRTALEAYKQCESNSKGLKYMIIMRLMRSGSSQQHYPEYVITMG